MFHTNKYHAVITLRNSSLLCIGVILPDTSLTHITPEVDKVLDILFAFNAVLASPNILRLPTMRSSFMK